MNLRLTMMFLISLSLGGCDLVDDTIRYLTKEKAATYVDCYNNVGAVIYGKFSSMIKSYKETDKGYVFTEIGGATIETNATCVFTTVYTPRHN